MHCKENPVYHVVKEGLLYPVAVYSLTADKANTSLPFRLTGTPKYTTAFLAVTMVQWLTEPVPCITCRHSHCICLEQQTLRCAHCILTSVTPTAQWLRRFLWAFHGELRRNRGKREDMSMRGLDCPVGGDQVCQHRQACCRASRTFELGALFNKRL